MSVKCGEKKNTERCSHIPLRVKYLPMEILQRVIQGLKVFTLRDTSVCYLICVSGLSKSDQCEILTCGEICSCAIIKHSGNLLCIF